MSIEPQYLRVFCDYSATGVWDLKTGFSVELAEINVPYWLAMMFDEWQVEYDMQDYTMDDGEEMSSLDKTNHDCKGLALAHKLLHYLPVGSEVWFVYESDALVPAGTYENVDTGQQLTSREQIRNLHEERK